VTDDREWASVFDQECARDASAVQERIWREVMGREAAFKRMRIAIL